MTTAMSSRLSGIAKVYMLLSGSWTAVVRARANEQLVPKLGKRLEGFTVSPATRVNILKPAYSSAEESGLPRYTALLLEAIMAATVP